METKYGNILKDFLVWLFELKKIINLNFLLFKYFFTEIQPNMSDPPPNKNRQRTYDLLNAETKTKNSK